MKIIGIDPALCITGYGVIQVKNKKQYLVTAGIIKTTARENILERLEKIYRGIEKILKSTKPDVLVLEKLYAHWRHPTTSFILGQARGVICLACAIYKIKFAEYPATRVKKAIVGRGNASKEQIQRMVIGLLGLKRVPKYSDITDALALALTHSFIIQNKFLELVR
ncbi:MAG: crossover junction endodeoxyribonuclease RuvC [Candidatus Omnitrophica bacterium]|nr:crossover junction endodeoxyribonuclease RuvC [Candidatus Omnitrophota bacterium]